MKRRGYRAPLKIGMHRGKESAEKNVLQKTGALPDKFFHKEIGKGRFFTRLDGGKKRGSKKSSASVV